MGFQIWLQASWLKYMTFKPNYDISWYLESPTHWIFYSRTFDWHFLFGWNQTSCLLLHIGVVDDFDALLTCFLLVELTGVIDNNFRKTLARSKQTHSWGRFHSDLSLIKLVPFFATYINIHTFTLESIKIIFI